MKKKNPLFIEHAIISFVTNKYVTERTVRGGSLDDYPEVESYRICPLRISDNEILTSFVRDYRLGIRLCRTTMSEK